MVVAFINNNVGPGSNVGITFKFVWYYWPWYFASMMYLVCMCECTHGMCYAYACLRVRASRGLF